MQRSFLIFAMAFVALMAGALFYAAKMPVTQPPGPQVEHDPNAPVEPQRALEGPVTVSFVLADMSGGRRDFAEWQGQHRLLNFWATWCAPCRREIPLLKAFQDQHGTNGLQVIGIAVDFPELGLTWGRSTSGISTRSRSPWQSSTAAKSTRIKCEKS